MITEASLSKLTTSKVKAPSKSGKVTAGPRFRVGRTNSFHLDIAARGFSDQHDGIRLHFRYKYSLT